MGVINIFPFMGWRDSGTYTAKYLIYLLEKSDYFVVNAKRTIKLLTFFVKLLPKGKVNPSIYNLSVVTGGRTGQWCFSYNRGLSRCLFILGIE